MGRTGGGTFNLFLKSGTNQLHGAAFGYTWVQSMLANTFFADAGGRNTAGQLNNPIANQPFYNYGAAIGGPVVIPKVYNGKNKTFFWFSGEGYRQTEAATASETVPTALEKNRRLLAKLEQNWRSAADVLSGRERTHSVLHGNVIPQSMINPVGLALASVVPAAVLQACLCSRAGLPGDGGDLRSRRPVHQQTRPADHFRGGAAMLSYLHYGSREESNPWFGYADPGTPNQGMLVRHADATQANMTFTPTATMVVFLRWGFNRFPNQNLSTGEPGNESGSGRPGLSLIPRFAASL